MTTRVAPTHNNPAATKTSATTEPLRRLESVETIALPNISAFAKLMPKRNASDNLMLTFDTQEARNKFEAAIFDPREPNKAFLKNPRIPFPSPLRFRCIDTPTHNRDISIYWTDNSTLNNTNQIIETLKAIKV